MPTLAPSTQPLDRALAFADRVMRASRGVGHGVGMFAHAIAIMENRKLFEPFAGPSPEHPDHHQTLFMADHASVAGSVWSPAQSEAGDQAGFITLAWAIGHLSRHGLYVGQPGAACEAQGLLSRFLPTVSAQSEPWGYAVSTSGWQFDPAHLWKAIRSMPADAMQLHESVGVHVAQFDHDLKVAIRAELRQGADARTLETDARAGPVFARMRQPAETEKAKREVERHQRDWRALATFSQIVRSLNGNGVGDLGGRLSWARLDPFEAQQRIAWNERVGVDHRWVDVHAADAAGQGYRIPAPAELAQNVAARHNVVAAMAAKQERERGFQLASRTAHDTPSPGVSRATSLQARHGFQVATWAKAARTVVTAGVDRLREQDMRAAPAQIDPHLRYKVVARDR